MWALLLVTLPTQPNAVRLRIWRSLKSLGCAALRDGAYVLPSEHVAALDAIASEVREHGGNASVLALAPRNDAQHREVLALFDRGAAYAQGQADAKARHLELKRLADTDARRRLRGVADGLAALQRIDYYPGAAFEQAQSELATLRGVLDARFSQGEPRALAGRRTADGLVRLDRAKFQGKRWATRARPWVDRLASAWLIRRFIDKSAEFVWLSDATLPIRTPRGALGFDYDGARFTHVGALVTFEVLVASFGLQQDTRLQRIGAVVHYLDAGGIPAAEAAGLESVLGGLRELHAHDDRLLAAAAVVFDALYASPNAVAGESP